MNDFKFENARRTDITSNESAKVSLTTLSWGYERIMNYQLDPSAPYYAERVQCLKNVMMILADGCDQVMRTYTQQHAQQAYATISQRVTAIFMDFATKYPEAPELPVLARTQASRPQQPPQPLPGYVQEEIPNEVSQEVPQDEEDAQSASMEHQQAAGNTDEISEEVPLDEEDAPFVNMEDEQAAQNYTVDNVSQNVSQDEEDAQPASWKHHEATPNNIEELIAAAGYFPQSFTCAEAISAIQAIASGYCTGVRDVFHMSAVETGCPLYINAEDEIVGQVAVAHQADMPATIAMANSLEGFDAARVAVERSLDVASDVDADSLVEAFAEKSYQRFYDLESELKRLQADQGTLATARFWVRKILAAAGRPILLKHDPQAFWTTQTAYWSTAAT